MTIFLTTLLILLCLVIVLLILIQRTSGGMGSALGGGAADQVLGAGSAAQLDQAYCLGHTWILHSSSSPLCHIPRPGWGGRNLTKNWS